MNESLAAWLELEHRILKAERGLETAFIAVNFTHSLVDYRQAALWSRESGMIALSAAARVESSSPYVLWLNEVFSHLHAKAGESLPLHPDLLPAPLAAQWSEWFPAQALFLPLGDEALIFARSEPFEPDQIALLERLAALVSLSRRALSSRRRWRLLPGKGRVWLGAALILVTFLVPVTGSVLAPAELVPANPILVRAPLDGVIDRFHVKPNEPVRRGQNLFDLDTTTLTGKLDVARQQHATAAAEYRQSAQAMVFDAEAKARIAILNGKVEEKAAEVRLLENQLARLMVTAPRAGIAVFDEVSEWVGKPVAVGEKVLIVTDETDTEIEAWISISDIGEVALGSRLTLFLNTAPLSPLSATVRSIAYEASHRPDDTIAHRIRATLVESETKPRLGLQGTARIDGTTIPLVWWLFRRPVGAIRQFIGF